MCVCVCMYVCILVKSYFNVISKYIRIDSFYRNYIYLFEYMCTYMCGA